ncbi:MAG: D-2-hydroxyacid dehydrogenase [Gemmatimonadetes bacterium]|nr:D-2-hydroxyacid dehydrogenase [Gemmatimonadota bacterium]
MTEPSRSPAALPPGFPLPFAPRRVVIANALHAEIADRVRAARPDVAVRGGVGPELTDADFAWAEACIGFRRPPHLTSLGGVRWVQSTGAGVDGWLRGAPLDAGILVTRSSELFGAQICEWAIARIFAIQQRVLPLAAAQRERQWAQQVVPRVAGTRALLVGTGDIGRTIATALTALGVHCTGVSRSGRSSHTAFRAMHTLDALPALVGTHDWIIVSLPDTAETRGLVSRAVLSQARGAVLLNAGRGAVVEEAALPEALDAGWLRAAALDVFEQEPLPPDSPLWHDPRVLVSPHMSGLTTAEGAAGAFLECLASLERGELPGWAIDRSRGY